jgi:hypothetical protein
MAAAAAVQNTYTVVNPPGGAREIRRNMVNVVTSKIHLLDKHECIRRFYCDVIKDSQEQPQIADIIQKLNFCIPPPLPLPPPPLPPPIPPAIAGYQGVLQVLETAVYNGCSSNIVEYKNILKTSAVGSNIQISDAIRVFWESGFGCRSVCRDPHMRTVKTPAATLDSLPKQNYDELFNQHVTFDATFTEELGFPPSFTWSTVPNGVGTDESIVNVNFGVGLNMNVNGIINNRIRNHGAFGPLVLGNKDKNININNLFTSTAAQRAANCPMIKKLLIMKEIGDVAQVWMYLAYADIGNYQRNQLLMVTTDSVVYLLCMLLDLSCIYTGARAGVQNGCCTLKHYLSGPIDYIARCKNMMEVYKQKVVQHNTSIAFALKIMLADPSKFDYYIYHGLPPVGPVAPQHVRRVLATKGLTQFIRIQQVNQMIQREINRIELATAAIEAIFVNVTKILIIIPALLPVQAAAFAAYHYFIAAAQAAAAAAAVAAGPPALGAPAAVLAAAVPTALVLAPGAENAARDAAQQTVAAAAAAAVAPAAVAPAAVAPAAVALAAAAVAAAAVPAGAAALAAAAVPAAAVPAAAAAVAAVAAAAAAVPAGPAVPAGAAPAVVAAILLAALAGRAAGAAAAKAHVAKLQAQGFAVTMAAVLAEVITVSTLSVVTFAARVVQAAAAAGAAGGMVNQEINDTYSNFCKSIDIFKEPALFTQLPNKRYIILPGRFLNQFVGFINPAAVIAGIPQNIDLVIAGVQAAAAAANVRLYGGSINRLQHAGAGGTKQHRSYTWSATPDEPEPKTNFYDCLIACYVADRLRSPVSERPHRNYAAADPAVRPVHAPVVVGNNVITDFNNNYDYPDPNVDIQENLYNIQIAFALKWDRVVNELMNEEHKIFNPAGTPTCHDLQNYIDNDLQYVSDASIIARGKRLLNFVYLAPDLAIETAELEKIIRKAQLDYGYPTGISAINPVQEDWVIDTRFHDWMRRRGGRANRVLTFMPSLPCGNRIDRITNKRIEAAFAIRINSVLHRHTECYDVTTFVNYLKNNDVTVDDLIDFYTRQPLRNEEKRQIANYIIMVYKLTPRVMQKLSSYGRMIQTELNSYYAQQGGGGIGNTDIKRKTIKRKLHYKNKSKNQKIVNKHRMTRRNNIKTRRRTRKHRN